MTGETHLIFGTCCGILYATQQQLPINQAILLTITSSAMSLFPDIDIDNSKANKALGIVGKGISKITKHRGFIHTPILYLVLSLLFTNIIHEGVLIGALSHLILDTLNSKGIMWLWPISNKHIHLARIKTGGKGEKVVKYTLLILTIISEIYLLC